MANRLSRIVTRTGDDGTTGLGDGSRVGKDALRVEVMGAIDELNSAIGCVLAEDVPGEVRAALTCVQNDLFDLGGEVCIPGRVALESGRLGALEAMVERMNEPLAPLKEFVLPGGVRAGAACHLARAVCRRVERSLVALSRKESVTPLALQYLNRASDLLFIAARTINVAARVPEAMWRPGGKPP